MIKLMLWQDASALLCLSSVLVWMMLTPSDKWGLKLPEKYLKEFHLNDAVIKHGV